MKVIGKNCEVSVWGRVNNRDNEHVAKMRWEEQENTDFFAENCVFFEERKIKGEFWEMKVYQIYPSKN